MNTTLAKTPSIKLTAPNMINPVERLVLTSKILEIVRSLAKIPPPIKIPDKTPNARIGLWYSKVLEIIDRMFNH